MFIPGLFQKWQVSEKLSIPKNRDAETLVSIPMYPDRDTCLWKPDVVLKKMQIWMLILLQ